MSGFTECIFSIRLVFEEPFLSHRRHSTPARQILPLFQQKLSFLLIFKQIKTQQKEDSLLILINYFLTSIHLLFPSQYIYSASAIEHNLYISNILISNTLSR